jgi:hypothetical protein
VCDKKLEVCDKKLEVCDKKLEVCDKKLEVCDKKLEGRTILSTGFERYAIDTNRKALDIEVQILYKSGYITHGKKNSMERNISSGRPFVDSQYMSQVS